MNTQALAVMMALLVCAAPALSQEELLHTSALTVGAEIDMAADRLNLMPAPAPAPGSRLSNPQLRLEGGDLILDYELQPGSVRQYYQISLEATLNGRPLALRRENLSGDLGQRLTVSEPGGSRRILITNLLEDYPTLRGTLALTLSARLFGPRELPLNIDCSTPPTFAFKQQRWHLAAAGVGAAALFGGQLFNSRSDKEYDDYLRSPNAGVAEPFFQQARSDHQTYLSLTYAGAAILALDAGWWLVRYLGHKRRLRLYEKYCNPGTGLQWQPAYRLDTRSGTATVGVSLQYRFR